MKEVRKTTQFKKDFKRYKNNKNIIETLFQLVGLLVEDKQIPEEYYPHSLKGNWNDYMECHIENDTLLRRSSVYNSFSLSALYKMSISN